MASMGEQISAARKAKGMTQNDLANAMNVSRATVSNWEIERRLPDAKTLLKLSKVLDYSFEAEAARRPEDADPAPEAGDQATRPELPFSSTPDAPGHRRTPRAAGLPQGRCGSR